MVSPPVLAIGGIGILLLLGLLSDRISDGNNNFPRLLALMASGFLLGQLVLILPFEPITEAITYLEQPELVGFLAELALALVLFREGLELNFKAFLQNLRPILILAFFGVFISTFLFSQVITLIFGFPLLISLLIAGMLVPTDPAATFSMFKGNLRLKARVQEIIGGESAINDAVAIALVTEFILISFLEGDTQLSFSTHVIRALLISFFGGILLGYLLGLIFLKINTKLNSSEQTDFLSLALVILAFFIAIVLHSFNLPISSAITALTSGVVFGNPTSFRFSRFSLAEVDEFHTNISELGELIAFTALGTIIRLDKVVIMVEISLFLAIASIMIRMLVVFVLLRSTTSLSGKESIFIGWGGLRGLATGVLATVAFYQISERPDLIGNLSFTPQEFLSMVLVTLFFSTIIQGLPMKYVAKKTETIILMDRIEELELKKRILTLQLTYLQDQKTRGILTTSEYHLQSIPIRDKLTQVLHDLEVEYREEWRRINSYLLQYEMVNYVLANLGVQKADFEDNPEIDMLVQEEEDLTKKLVSEIERLGLRLETEKEQISSKEEKEIEILISIYEKLCEIREKYDSTHVNEVLSKLQRFDFIKSEEAMEEPISVSQGS
ncbi:MAG: hypothetical protein D6732_29105 [Methanobacteriota archaeon]|nr:MAG: hypothetical protein D6732_29105 [Euryarchaeota archaeon]